MVIHSIFKVECDEFAVSVLQARQKDGLIPECGITHDVVSYKPDSAALDADLLSAGFPCQAEQIFVLSALNSFEL